ncbi:MAG: radical SAM protein [Elusimicrobiota bacterium]
MPNFMITNTCNLNCSYCFGRDQMRPLRKKEFMTRATFLNLLKWLDGSKNNYFHLMGGEPTLHPDFLWMLETARKRSFTVDIFSNGITKFTPDEMKAAKDTSHDWVINVNDPSKYNKTMRGRLEDFLSVLGKQAVLTFNVINVDYDPAFLLDYIDKYKLKRSVKIGIALPTVQRTNLYASHEEFGGLSASMLRLAGIFKKHDIRGEFECGVPSCFFSDKDKVTLDKCGFDYSSGCRSILDILPNGEVIYCLPLAKIHKVKYNKYGDYGGLKQHFEEFYLPYRGVGYKKECLSCKCKSNCYGSCLSRIIPNFSQIPA